MSALQPIHGLYQAAARKIAGAAWIRTQANEEPTQAEARAIELEAAAAEIRDQIHEDIATINTLEFLMHTLATSKFQTPHRTLAIRAMEEASGRLRRELGDPVEETGNPS